MNDFDANARIAELEEQLAAALARTGTAVDTHPPGTIALPMGDLARYADFVISLATVDMPEGSRIASVKSMDVTSNLNAILREMFHGEWCFFIGDDHSFDRDVIIKLLDREVDVVVPMVAKKQPPFRLVDFTGSEMRTYDGDGREYPHYFHIDMSELPQEGLHPIHAAGSAGMLVRKHVLDAVGDPWFENPHGTVVNDDLEFCRKIREAGFQIWLDTEVYLTHIGQYKVYPGNRDGVWGLYLDFGGHGENRIFMASDPIPPEAYE